MRRASKGEFVVTSVVVGFEVGTTPLLVAIVVSEAVPQGQLERYVLVVRTIPGRRGRGPGSVKQRCNDKGAEKEKKEKCQNRSSGSDGERWHPISITSRNESSR
jgi:hypothetical protein